MTGHTIKEKGLCVKADWIVILLLLVFFGQVALAALASPTHATFQGGMKAT